MDPIRGQSIPASEYRYDSSSQPVLEIQFEKTACRCTFSETRACLLKLILWSGDWGGDATGLFITGVIFAQSFLVFAGAFGFYPPSLITMTWFCSCMKSKWIKPTTRSLQRCGVKAVNSAIAVSWLSCLPRSIGGFWRSKPRISFRNLNQRCVFLTILLSARGFELVHCAVNSWAWSAHFGQVRPDCFSSSIYSMCKKLCSRLVWRGSACLSLNQCCLLSSASLLMSASTMPDIYFLGWVMSIIWIPGWKAN